MAKTLTPKQEAFCQAMVTASSASEAYQRIYNSQKSNVSANASRLLALPHVAGRVQELRDRAAEAGIMTRHEALVVLSAIARGRPGDYLREDGTIDAAKVAKAGPEVEMFRLANTEHGAQVAIKLRDPIRAIELLARMQGWFKEGKEEPKVIFNIGLSHPRTA